MERIQRGSCGEKRLHRAKKKRNHSRYLFHFGGTAKENPMRRSARRRRNWQSPVVPQDATPTRRDANRNPRPGTAPANGHGPSPTTERHETQKEKRKKKQTRKEPIDQVATRSTRWRRDAPIDRRRPTGVGQRLGPDLLKSQKHKKRNNRRIAGLDPFRVERRRGVL